MLHIFIIRQKLNTPDNTRLRQEYVTHFLLPILSLPSVTRYDYQQYQSPGYHSILMTTASHVSDYNISTVVGHDTSFSLFFNRSELRMVFFIYNWERFCFLCHINNGK